MNRIITYLRELHAGKIILWCYLIWYIVMLRFYFEPNITLWLNALGISVVIGTALILSVMPAGGIGAMEKWAIARLFMMPFAVSSFAALIKNQHFTVILSPRWSENLLAAGACSLFVGGVWVCKKTK